MAFEGKVVLITGGNGGIGGGCAEYFASQGARLSLVGRNQKKFEKVLKNIRDSGVKVEPLVIIADVSTDAERIISETIAKYQRLDILINNAGFSIPGGIEDIKMSDYDAIFATNVRAVVELTHLAAPYLIASKGNIVTISSCVGLRAFKGFVAYCMSKSAINQFTRCVALDLAEKGVRVNAVNPTAVETDFHLGNGATPDTYNAVLDYMAQNHPLGKVCQVKDIVRAVVFLAHDDARLHTGATLPVDAGLIVKSPFN